MKTIRVFTSLFFLLGLLITNQTMGQAVDANKLKLPDGFQAELVYSVPRNQGSWVSMTTDAKGRLIASDQYGGLYRVNVIDGEQPQVEKIDLQIGFAQGLLCAFDSLYVVSHGVPGKKAVPAQRRTIRKPAVAAQPAVPGKPAGLYRVKDTNGDDKYDSVELLRQFQGGGEHGPHAVILSPDKQSLYICGGNHTNLPNPETSRVPRLWQEDQVLQRLPDANGHATGRMAPGGWICKTDPDGKWFELVSVGYRNEYDIAFDPNGELFTYDADMEWDVGLPWYRPTRVCHATSGSEFGWRYGTGKWPEYYPDSLPSVVDIGPGSPTGIVFGTGSKFPAKYQNALYLADWSYGVIYAVHLEPNGASFSGTKEVFCTAPALPVTDMVINQSDGAMYFLIGGRRAQSGLYRVSHKDAATNAPAKYPEPTELAKLRQQVDQLHGTKVEQAVEKAWPHLKHADRHIRFSARTAIENQDVKKWIDQAQSETDPQSSLEAILALARAGQPEDQAAAVNAMSRLTWNELSKFQQLHMLRNLGLMMVRMVKKDEPPSPELLALISKVGGAYPANDAELDREFSRVLIAAGVPDAIEKTLLVLKNAETQQQQIHFALALAAAKTEWTRSQREEYFQWFLDSAMYGGNSFNGYVRNIRKLAIDNMSEDERGKFKELLAKAPAEKDPYAELKARPFVKKWTLDDLMPIAESEFDQRDLVSGKKLFTVAQCFKCHRVQGQGGIVGPDLTPAGRRFNTRDLLETIVNPNKEISDQYVATKFQMADGETLVGRVVNINGDRMMVQPDMIRPNAVKWINKNDVDDMAPSKVSMMPEGLLDNFTKDEILDLLAYMKSTSPMADSKGEK